jgi:hypothetical protein
MAAPAPTYPTTLVPAPVILERVAIELGLSVDDLRGPRISQSLRFARGIVALLLAEYTPFSQAEIGRALGAENRRYAYVYGLKLRGDDERFRAALEQCRNRVLQWDGASHAR